MDAYLKKKIRLSPAPPSLKSWVRPCFTSTPSFIKRQNLMVHRKCTWSIWCLEEKQKVSSVEVHVPIRSPFWPKNKNLSHFFKKWDSVFQGCRENGKLLAEMKTRRERIVHLNRLVYWKEEEEVRDDPASWNLDYHGHPTLQR